jgi:hypothetical protein
VVAVGLGIKKYLHGRADRFNYLDDEGSGFGDESETGGRQAEETDGVRLWVDGLKRRKVRARTPSERSFRGSMDPE